MNIELTRAQADILSYMKFNTTMCVKVRRGRDAFLHYRLANMEYPNWDAINKSDVTDLLKMRLLQYDPAGGNMYKTYRLTDLARQIVIPSNLPGEGVVLG